MPDLNALLGQLYGDKCGAAICRHRVGDPTAMLELVRLVLATLFAALRSRRRLSSRTYSSASSFRLPCAPAVGHTMMAQGQHLGAKLGVGAGADQDEIGEEADKLLGEGEKHGSGIIPDRSRTAEVRPV